MSRADRLALRRYQDIYQSPSAHIADDTEIFYRAAESRGAPWYRIYLAESLSSRYGDDNRRNLVRWLLLHCALQAGAGHLRTDLNNLADEMPLWYLDETGEPPVGFNKDLPGEIRAELNRLLADGSAAGLFFRLSSEDAEADSLERPRPPMLLSADGNYAYFLRRRREEDYFLALLDNRTQGAQTPDDDSAAGFPLPSGDLNGPSADLLKKLAQGRRVLLLAGGPGTGKTTTVAELIRLIERGRQENGMPPINAALAAPTGRAASRLGMSLSFSGRTIHSLLGLYPGRAARYNKENPLPYELVVVDEASMVDLPLMNSLLSALNPQSALLLVGDPDQLPSVEAGALLGDLLTGNNHAVSKGEQGPLSGAIVKLTTSYRSNKTILNAAAAVRAGNLEQLEAAVVFGSKTDGVRLHAPLSPEELALELAKRYASSRSPAAGPASNRGTLSESLKALFKLYASFTALTPVRKGPYGVISLNQRITELVSGGGRPFGGMPIMITRNDEQRNLWNGDRGVLMEIDGRLQAVFEDVGNTGGTDSPAGYRVLPTAVLPAWEPAWMQTIHKSQGSEFDEVLVVLPAKAGALLTCEILYTALTRARNRVDLIADNESLSLALTRRVERNSRIRRWAAGGVESVEAG